MGMGFDFFRLPLPVITPAEAAPKSGMPIVHRTPVAPESALVPMTSSGVAPVLAMVLMASAIAFRLAVGCVTATVSNQCQTCLDGYTAI